MAREIGTHTPWRRGGETVPDLGVCSLPVLCFNVRKAGSGSYGDFFRDEVVGGTVRAHCLHETFYEGV